MDHRESLFHVYANVKYPAKHLAKLSMMPRCVGVGRLSADLAHDRG